MGHQYHAEWGSYTPFSNSFTFQFFISSLVALVKVRIITEAITQMIEYYHPSYLLECFKRDWGKLLNFNLCNNTTYQKHIIMNVKRFESE